MSFDLVKKTWMTWLWAWTKIPLLAAVRPRIEAMDERHCIIRIPLRRRTKNHLGSMYFGALAIGADMAGGLLAVELIRARKAKVSLAFKSFQAQFLKRPESDVYFICEVGDQIRAQVERTLASEERQTEPVPIRAAVKLADGTFEDVATFVLELSLKRSEKGAV